MFQEVFGKPKTETSSVIVTIGKLREGVFSKKAAAEVEKAKEFTREKNKKAVIQCLKRKRLYEQEIEKLGNFQLRVHDQVILLEGAKATNIGDLDKSIDDINEQTDFMKQIQDALSAPNGEEADFDATDMEDADLEAELLELEGADLEEHFIEPDILYVPAGQLAHPMDKAGEDDLAALPAELGM